MRAIEVMSLCVLGLSALACDGPAKRACEGDCGELLCPVVRAYEEVDEYNEAPPGQAELKLSNRSALDCALAALRDRTPGRLKWDYTPAHVLGAIEGEICIDESGGIRHQTTTYDDLDINHSAVVYGEPKSAEQYADCLDPSTSARTRLNCLMAAPVEIERTCEEARWEDALL